ncbi:MAG: GNAT family N-acetyltransferase [Cyclobacteriaceae bacterium]
MNDPVLIPSAEAINYLSDDPFSNLMTLKMLTMYPEWCRCLFYGRFDDGWALRTELPTEHSHWDRQVYPDYQTIVMIDGNTKAGVLQAIEEASLDSAVFKLHDPHTVAQMDARSGISHRVSFISYSSAPTAEPTVVENDIPAEAHADYSEEAASLFAQNLYTQAEVEEHISRGARWFGVRHETELAAICIAFPIYSNIWEIGGVFTLPSYRRRGYAQTVVLEALRFLRGKDLRPRYQFKQGNVESQALAQSVGLEHVLTVSHYTTAN